jgi:hypothetical protein
MDDEMFCGDVEFVHNARQGSHLLAETQEWYSSIAVRCSAISKMHVLCSAVTMVCSEIECELDVDIVDTDVYEGFHEGPLPPLCIYHAGSNYFNTIETAAILEYRNIALSWKQSSASCTGLSNSKFSVARDNVKQFGRLKLSHILAVGSSFCNIFPAIHALLMCLRDSSVKETWLSVHNLKLYECNRYSIRAVLCTSVVTQHNGLCKSCFNLQVDRSLQQRVLRATSPQASPESNYNAYASNTNKVAMQVTRRVSTQSKCRVALKSKMKCTRLRKLVSERATFFKNATAACDGGDILKMIRLLVRAHANEVEIQQSQLITGTGDQHTLQISIAKRLCSLISQKASSVPCRVKQHDSSIMNFFTVLMSHTGPKVHDLVSRQLGGPCVRSTKTRIAAMPKMQCGFVESQVAFAYDLLVRQGLQDVLCLIAEDGTSLRKHIDITRDGAGDVEYPFVVHGCSGGPHRVSSPSGLIALLTTNSMAVNLYVHYLVPLMPNVKPIPIVAQTINQKFDSEEVIDWWRVIWALCNKYGIRVAGHCSDGASNLRKAMYTMTSASEPVPSRYVELPTSFMGARVPIIPDMGPVMFFSDYMHIFWRMRVYLLDLTRSFCFGGTPVIGASLIRSMLLSRKGGAQKIKRMPTESDLSRSDKQNWYACCRLFGIDYDTGYGVPADESIVELIKVTSYSDYLYYNLVRTFMSAFIPAVPMVGHTSTEYVQGIVDKCAYCIAFVGLWSHIVNMSDLTIKRHFLPTVVATDIIFACSMTILSVKVWREHYPDEHFSPHQFSTKRLENLFGQCRSLDRNSDQLTSVGAVRALSVVLLQLNTHSSHLETRSSRRTGKVSFNTQGDGTVGIDWKILTDDSIVDIMLHAHARAEGDIRKGVNASNFKWVPLTTSGLKAIVTSYGLPGSTPMLSPHRHFVGDSSLLDKYMRSDDTVRHPCASKVMPSKWSHNAGPCALPFFNTEVTLFLSFCNGSLYDQINILEMVSSNDRLSCFGTKHCTYERTVMNTSDISGRMTIHGIVDQCVCVDQCFCMDYFPDANTMQSFVDVLDSDTQELGYAVFQDNALQCVIPVQVLKDAIFFCNTNDSMHPKNVVQRIHVAVNEMCRCKEEDFDAIVHASAGLPNAAISNIFTSSDFENLRGECVDNIRRVSPQLIRDIVLRTSTCDWLTVVNLFCAYQNSRTPNVFFVEDLHMLRAPLVYAFVVHVFLTDDLGICVAVFDQALKSVYMGGPPIHLERIWATITTLGLDQTFKRVCFRNYPHHDDSYVATLVQCVAIDKFVTAVVNEHKGKLFPASHPNAPADISFYTRMLLLMLINYPVMFEDSSGPVFPPHQNKFATQHPEITFAGVTKPFDTSDLTVHDFASLHDMIEGAAPEYTDSMTRNLYKVLRVANTSFTGYSREREHRFNDQKCTSSFRSMMTAESIHVDSTMMLNKGDYLCYLNVPVVTHKNKTPWVEVVRIDFIRKRTATLAKRKPTLEKMLNTVRLSSARDGTTEICGTWFKVPSRVPKATGRCKIKMDPNNDPTKYFDAQPIFIKIDCAPEVLGISMDKYVLQFMEEYRTLYRCYACDL